MRDKISNGAEGPGVQRRRRVVRGRVTAIVVLALIVDGPAMLFGVGPLILKSYDVHHMIEVHCVANAARADVASSRGTNGVGSSDPQVVIGTSCGELILKRGVSRDNMRKIADAVEVDRSYVFSVGEGSFDLRSTLRLLHVSPETYGMELIKSVG
ncbi:hypothetical protein [Curtobacterium flaccumfaciens]|uniref:hypothetical protein n=1 Tax=Curtobacterium flaccumfaciens TaxID=2035 RepID=UPI001ADC6BAF|nr:hypothetical protein [Curtobacterium flaccumfaciens]MBO9041132.1 hypothetical protein [Curtobacterium flaccumfaciens pv. flaccumfaciens]